MPAPPSRRLGLDWFETERALECRLRLGADGGRGRLTVSEQNHRGNRGDPVPLGEALLLVDVDLHELEVAVAFLGDPVYANGRTASTSDFLDAANGFYQQDAQRLRAAGYGDRVYGRAVTTGGKTWLQYWLFSYYNPQNVLGFGVHEGDWEFVQIGNCGSPIELEEGWLMLTHGVGPVRKYSIGAALLDKRDPSRVLARSSEPLLRPEPSEREGYVPNVVYTCGAMAHNDQLILPYAVSDTYSNFATIQISALMRSMS